jgi:hypothetical protein
MYGKDDPFNDPVVRCDSCSRILLVTKLREIGNCVCGSRKVRNVLGFTESEHDVLESWDVDPKWLRLFESVDDTGIGPKP